MPRVEGKQVPEDVTLGALPVPHPPPHPLPAPVLCDVAPPDHEQSIPLADRQLVRPAGFVGGGSEGEPVVDSAQALLHAGEVGEALRVRRVVWGKELGRCVSACVCPSKNSRPVHQQQLDHVEAGKGGGTVESGPATMVKGVHLRPSSHQQLGNF